MTPKPFKENYLPEKDGYKIYYAEYGNKGGEKIITFHGGPGDKSEPRHVELYDLNKFHVIAFDQRGCGKSIPNGEVKENTVVKTIEDVERIRQKLKIEKWYVAGGSWGSTLALVYAQSHAKNVLGLLLSAIFLGTNKEDLWSFSSDKGVSNIFPDLWDNRLKLMHSYNTNPSKSAKDLLKLLSNSDEKQTAEITSMVINWEGNLMSSQTDVNLMDPEEVTMEDVGSVKVFLSYQANNFFLSPNQILSNISSISNIPTIIIHGRYDVLCPAINAYNIHKKLKNSELIFLPSSNHRFTAEGGLVRKLAFDKFLLEQENKNSNL